MSDPLEFPGDDGTTGSLSPLLLMMLVGILLAGTKLIAAYYTGVLLLAADGLYTLVVWYRKVFSPAIPRRKRSESMAAIIPGIILASAGLGIAWNSVAEGLELFQGLSPRGFSPLALILAVACLLIGYIARRIISLRKMPDTGGELYFERGVSTFVLLPLSFASSGFSSAAGFLIISALIISLLVCVLAVQFVYSLIEGILVDKDS